MSKPLTRRQSNQYQQHNNQDSRATAHRAQQPQDSLRLVQKHSINSFGGGGSYATQMNKLNSKQSSINAIGRQQSQNSIGHIKKRESKRMSKISPKDLQAQQEKAKQLECYNDKKAVHESKELPTRQVFLRRIGLQLVKITKYSDGAEESKKKDSDKEFLFKFPILEYVEEVSKIMLLSEFELTYWYLVLERYLTCLAENVADVKEITAIQVRVIFFQTAMFVKHFLLQTQERYQKPKITEERIQQIECIMAYVKEYHYTNFDENYTEFDRLSHVLLSPHFEHLKHMDISGESKYESMSFLSNLNMSIIHKTFQELRVPFQIDKNENVIDYNWHVDGILKNSQSYNKDPKKGKEGEIGASNNSNFPIGASQSQVPEPQYINQNHMPAWRFPLEKANSFISKRPSEIAGQRSNLGGGAFQTGGIGSALSRQPSYTNNNNRPPFDFYPNIDQQEYPSFFQQLSMSNIFNSNVTTNQNGFEPTNIDHLSSPNIGGGLRSGIFGAFDTVVSPNPNLPKPMPTMKPGSYQPTQYNLAKSAIPKNFDPSKLLDLGRTASNLGGLQQDIDMDPLAPLPVVAPSIGRENSFNAMMSKGFSNYSQLGNNQVRQNNQNSAFGGFGGFGGGYNSNQSAFISINNNNGLSKIPSATSTSLSKINSAFGGYANIQSNFAKQNNNEYLELLQRFNPNSGPSGPSPVGLSLGRHPSMRDQIPLEDLNAKSQKQPETKGKGGKSSQKPGPSPTKK